MSWAFIPSLIGCMLLMFGVVNIVEGNAPRGAVLLGLGAVFMAIFVWMMKRGAWMMPELGMFVVRLVGAVFVVVGGLLALSPVIWSDSSGSVMAGGVMLAIGFAPTGSRS